MASRKVSREGPPSRKISRQGPHRFQVNKVDGLKSIQSSGSEEDVHQFTYVNDTQFPKSFGQLTREALPKEDNYRHLGSIHAKPRPTLEELRNGTYIAEAPPTDDKGHPGSGGPEKGKVVKFGWLEGVLMRCLLNIWGVMLFLRMSWCIGQAGLMEGLLLISLANIVTFITALSMSAVSTNGQISGGGIYYMISRSLGPEFGAAIGLMFTIANSVAVSLHTIGFCESLNDLLKQYFEVEFLGGNDDLNSVRVIGAIVLICILCLAFVGMDWVTRAQMLFLVILVAAQVDFIVGSIMGPGDDAERKAQGFIGYNTKTLATNFWSDYRTGYGNDVQQNFFTVFGVFFPSVTGIVAGANLSGDLKDPAGAIPKGTLLAITITYVSYVFYSTMMSGCAMREASGNVTQYLNDSLDSSMLSYDNCVDQECDYGLLNSSQVMELISAWGPLIYMGCFAATLSSAIASLVGAPRVLQALAKDRLYPFIHFFAKGYGANNDPIRGYLLVFGLSLGCIAIAELNAIAPIQSNFFLMAYCLINFSCFHATITKSPGWRPAFKYYNGWVSLLGSVMCVVVMFLMSWVMALVTIAVVTFLYLFLTYSKPDVNWGSSTQAQSYNSALKSVQSLNEVAEHVKNYRPQLLVLSGGMGTRPVLIDFAYLITKNISLMVCGHVSTEEYNQKMRNALNSQASHWLMTHQRKAFYSLVEAEKFEEGCRSLMQTVGLGKLRPNMLLMGYKGDWGKVGNKKLQEYFGILNHAFGLHLSVGILRVQGGLDYSGVVEEEGEANPETLMEELRKKAALSRANSQNKKKVSQDAEEEAWSSSDGGEDSPPEVRKLSNNLKDGDANQDPRTRKISHYVMPGGAELPQTILEDVTRFTRKQKKGTIDVWWLYDDGGLTLLVPYILSTRRLFNGSSLRVFIVSSKSGPELEMEKITMAGLLAKFRIEFSAVVVIGDIQRKAEEKTKREFDHLTEPFISMQESPDGSTISRAEFMANRERTNRYLRLSEELQKHSSGANVVVMTLPIPRKGTVSVPLYMAWLEIMSKKMPPFLYLRGNQTSVLTFYS